MCKDGESLYPNNSSPSTILQLYHNRENGNKCFYSRKSIKESDITISSELLLWPDYTCESYFKFLPAKINFVG